MEEEEPNMFAMGRDEDFVGLRETDRIDEVNEDIFGGGRDIEVNELLNEYREENAMFDRDVGESSEDEQ